LREAAQSNDSSEYYDYTDTETEVTHNPTNTTDIFDDDDYDLALAQEADGVYIDQMRFAVEQYKICMKVLRDTDGIRCGKLSLKEHQHVLLTVLHASTIHEFCNISETNWRLPEKAANNHSHAPEETSLRNNTRAVVVEISTAVETSPPLVEMISSTVDTAPEILLPRIPHAAPMSDSWASYWYIFVIAALIGGLALVALLPQKREEYLDSASEISCTSV